MKTKILMLSLMASMSNNALAFTFAGVDFESEFDKNAYELIDSTKDNSFNYKPYESVAEARDKVMSYDFVIKNKEDSAFEYTGVVLNTRKDHREKGFPFVVVACSESLDVPTLKYSLMQKYQNSDEFKEIVISNRMGKYEYSRYTFTVNSLMNDNYRSCIEVKRKYRSNYQWQSFGDPMLKSALEMYDL